MGLFRIVAPFLVLAGRGMAPAGDSAGAWIRRFVDSSHCMLREVGVDGRELHAPDAFPCASTLTSGRTLGLVMNRTHVIDPVTGRPVLDTHWGVLGVAGERVVLAGPDKQFELIDASGHVLLTLRWPSILYGLDASAVDPRGRYVALGLADPAWLKDGKQAMDVWVLDTATLKLTHMPATPAFVHLKFTSMASTDDGRLIFLAERDDGKNVVAMWRPGGNRLAVKTLRLPQRTGGSDQFAPVG